MLQALYTQRRSQRKTGANHEDYNNGKYPETLGDLVSKKYLRSIQPDPITDSNQIWLIVEPEGSVPGKVYDIKSGAPVMPWTEGFMGNGEDDGWFRHV